ncbi:hypothetical protein RB195_024892 [Necator americanus]|uniref:Reverse transcriptase domain-containing protein n=1 Tax=Necator americanus TaxID=51031 RepID=A0ABR1EPZ7_NECAM
MSYNCAIQPILFGLATPKPIDINEQCGPFVGSRKIKFTKSQKKWSKLEPSIRYFKRTALPVAYTKRRKLLEVCTALQTSLAKMSDWASKWDMRINYDKSLDLHVGKGNVTEYIMNGVT